MKGSMKTVNKGNRGGEDARVQSVPGVVGSGPHPGGI